MVVTGHQEGGKRLAKEVEDTEIAATEVEGTRLVAGLLGGVLSEGWTFRPPTSTHGWPPFWMDVWP